ncbi:MAG TPA: class II glutamine amidotransferase [Xanthomonadales bacterium]|nr:class II glutamine amidotransferase [Xanthomonadales bacterium]
MCELLAISSRLPAKITYSLEEFSTNGSRLRSNRDGWGIGVMRDLDAVLLKEPKPASDSVWVKFAAENALATTFAMAHVRYATRGNHTMENTHPFRRVLGRRPQLFAHNGTLSGLDEWVKQEAPSFLPIGETDSELAFCILLTRLEPYYKSGAVPELADRFEVFRSTCSDMSTLGPCNFLYHDGEVLFAHAHKRVYEEDGEMGEPRPPGLHLKNYSECKHDGKLSSPGLEVALQHQQTAILASVPLDDHDWEALDEGTVLAIREGEIVRRGSSLG